MTKWLLTALTGLACSAATGESWYSFDLARFETRRWSFTPHVQSRSSFGNQAFSYARAGMITGFDFHPRVSAVTGYYFEVRHNDDEFNNNHRSIAGAAASLRQMRRYEITTRGVFETFFGGPDPHRTRWRHRIRLEPFENGVFFGPEYFAEKSGIRAVRVVSGFRVPLTREMRLEVSYFPEYRRNAAAAFRHVFSTSIRFERSESAD